MSDMVMVHGIKAFSAAGFLLLFPFFAFYHTFIAFGIIQPVFGGLFGPVSLLLLVGFYLLTPWWLVGVFTRTGLYGVIVIFFFIYVVLWSCINFLFQYSDHHIEIAFNQSIKFVCVSIVLFVLGYSLPFDSVLLKRILVIFTLISFLYLLYYVVSSGNSMFYAKKMHVTGDGVVAYQGFARSAFVTILFLLAVSRRLLARGFIVLIGIFIIFVLGARSEFVAFVISVSLLFFAWSSVNFHYRLLTLLMIIGIVVISIINIDALSQSRQFQLTNILESNSWLSRMNLQKAAIAQIIESPILGLFGGHVIAHGSAGSYSHNALSAWVNYGAIGFFLFSLLCIIPPISGAYYVLVKRDFHPTALLSFVLGFSVILLIIFAKSVFWSMPALVWGIYASYIATHKVAQ